MKRFTNLVYLVLIVLLSSHNLIAAEVSGNVLYYGNTDHPINGVTVKLHKNQTNINKTCVTNTAGYFYFSDVIPGQYTLSGTTNLPGYEPSFYDAVLVFLHVAFNYPLSDMQFMAADVNVNSNVNWSDYNQIVNHILHGTPFPAGSWQFETMQITVTGQKEGFPVGGTCSGDVGGTFVPQNNNTPALPVAQVGEINVSKGESFKTRIVTNNAISFSGAGIIITYPANLLNIQSVEFKGVDYQYDIVDGQIRIIWGDPNTSPITFSPGETFVTIHGTTTQEFAPGMIASFGLAGNTSLISTSNQQVTNLSFASPVLKPGSTELKLENYPNPFASSTRLSIYTPVSGNGIIEVYNASGLMVMNIQAGRLESGNNEINLDASNLAKGYYICKLRIQTAGSEINTVKRLIKAQ